MTYSLHVDAELWRSSIASEVERVQRVLVPDADGHPGSGSDSGLVPVIEGAGGRMTDWQGQALTLDSKGEVIAVGDAALLPEIVSLLG